MRHISVASLPGRRLLRSVLALAAVCFCVVVASGSAVAGTPPPPAPAPAAPSSDPVPEPPHPASEAGPAASEPQRASLNTLIDPAMLESLQQSIVGLVIIWSEHEDPFAWLTAPPEAQDPAAQPELPVMSICTGWFDTPTTIATAGHCVDPEEGRIQMHLDRGAVDPETRLPAPVDYSRPAPVATVYAFQPRELPGAVLTSPVIVRVHSLRKAADGDTAKLEVHGMPPAKPLAIAPNAPKLGEPVTSIGFPGLNISDTDGINIEKLLEGGEGETPADILQDSRLHPVNTSGTIMSRQFRQGVAVYQVNADFAGGLSGGPTVNSRGQVLGINSQMTLAFFAQNFNVITDTGMLREFLGHDQPQEPGQPQPAPPPASVAVAPASETTPQLGRVDTTGSAAPTSSVGIAVISGLGGALLCGLAIWGTSRIRRRDPAVQKQETAA
jgi:Trypsin-like peptidase domain